MFPSWSVMASRCCWATAHPVALIVDPQLPQALWPQGRAVEAGGHVRTATVEVRDQTNVLLPKISNAEDTSNHGASSGSSEVR